MSSLDSVKKVLDGFYNQFNTLDFIQKDPILIPHHFSRKEDIEIAGFFAAILAWGNRTAILNSCKKLMDYMDQAPYEFVMNHTDEDLRKLEGFVYRTFNTTDLLYFISFFKWHYTHYTSLEDAFLIGELSEKPPLMKQRLINFKEYFFSLDYAPERTKKHISSPINNSTCKRINMFLRWMVRQDSAIDFGIWQKMKPSELIMPIDLHVSRVARKLGLLERSKDDWLAAEELTEMLKTFEPQDPVKYDIALFGAGVNYEL